MEMQDNIRVMLINLGFEPSELQIRQFRQFYDFLAEKNKVMNLTALDSPEDYLQKHLRDSLLLHRHFPLQAGKAIDVGTGAGFPGIPLAVMFPEISFTLLDSLAKRIHFLEEAVGLLQLSNVQTLWMRAETAGKNPQLRESFDYCVSRAVSHLNKLAEYCIPLVRVGGYFIPYKAEKVLQEIPESENAIRILGGNLESVSEDEIMGAKRYFPLIRKQSPTPTLYPRTSDKIAKKTL